MYRLFIHKHCKLFCLLLKGNVKWLQAVLYLFCPDSKTNLFSFFFFFDQLY